MLFTHPKLKLSVEGSIPGFTQTDTLGIVSGISIWGADAFKDIGAKIADFFGTKVRGYEKVMQKVKEEAWQYMIEDALKLGATGISGIKITVFPEAMSQGEIFVAYIYGTAVKGYPVVSASDAVSKTDPPAPPLLTRDAAVFEPEPESPSEPGDHFFPR